MLGGVTGPYLAYLKDGNVRTHLSSQRIFFSLSASAVYLTLVLLSVSVAKKFGKSAIGIAVTNSIVFIVVVLVSLGIVYCFE